MALSIEAMTPGHWGAVSKIYEEGIGTGQATFETEVRPWEEWDRSHLESCRFVAVLDGTVVGWAALSPVSDRCVYGGVAEVSLYVGAQARGKGIGRDLLARLVQSSEDNGIWTLQAGIFGENAASVRLHEALGFRTVGVRERLGRMNGVWRDVLLMERRSRTVGVE